MYIDFANLRMALNLIGKLDNYPVAKHQVLADRLLRLLASVETYIRFEVKRETEKCDREWIKGIRFAENGRMVRTPQPDDPPSVDDIPF